MKDNLYHYSVTLVVMGVVALLYVSIIFFTVGQSLEIRLLQGLILLVAVVLLTTGLSLIYYGLGKDKGHEQGLKDGEKRLIASLIDKGAIADERPLPAGEYELVKILHYDTSRGLLLNIGSKKLLAESYFKGEPMDRLQEGQIFTVDTDGTLLIKIRDALIEGDKAFVKV